jgi:hypothetical protein
MSELIPFRGKDLNGADADLGDDATEVTLDESAIIPVPRVTQRLPETPDVVAGLGEILAAPLNLLPPETQAHLRTAGREVTLTVTSLTATLLKGAAIVLNVAGEALRDYTERNSRLIDLQTARQARQRVEIEVE